jgi:hypothetical protein
MIWFPRFLKAIRVIAITLAAVLYNCCRARWALSSNSPASVIAFRECSVLFGTIIGLARWKR